MAKEKATRSSGRSARSTGDSASRISYCRIYPPIGIARVGNSESGFFVGPEVTGPPDASTFKDDTGRVKRQAARFRVYAFDRTGKAIRELRLDDKDVEKLEWSVTLANKKAAWHRFEGTQKAANILSRTDPLPQLRNSDLEGSDRDRLVIGPSTEGVSGANANGGELKGRFDEKETVYLGELKTDEAGRLLVLGGHGKAGTTRDDNPLRDYANNDRWYDDTSDGPVTVKVTVSGKSIPVRGRAWVIVAPPHYSPHTKNVVTAFDVMVQAAVDHDLTWNEKELGPKPSSTSVNFQDDILPILNRTVMYQWVNRQAQRGHSAGKRGDFTNPRVLRLLADPKSAKQPGSLHTRIFERTRTPLWYPLMPKAKEKSINLLDPKSQEARNQANLQFMPPISGDEGDTVHSEPWKWQTVTELQYEKLRAWKDGDFEGGVDLKSQLSPGDLSKVSIQDQPRCLIQASLDACQGGAFYPGIEVTSVIRHKQFYAEAFRVSDDLDAGDITKWMALPWLADFHACSFNWWPTVRPDDVVPDHEYEEILKEFEIERSENDLATLLIDRKPWDRGVRRLVGRPGLPPVDIGDTADRLHQRATTRISTLIHRYVTARSLRPSYDAISNTTQTTAAYAKDVIQYVADSLGIPDLVLPTPKPSEEAESYRKRALPEISKHLKKELDLPKPQADEDVDDYNERLTEFIDANDVGQNLINLEWRVRNRHSGKADFLDKWWKLGFILPRKTGENGETVFVESERGKYDLLDFRDYFYLLMNEEHYPDFLDKARELADEYLRLAEEFYPVLRSDPTLVQYSPFEYSPAKYRARLEKIYEINRRRAQDYNPVTGEGEPLFRTPDQVKQRILQLSPFNQLDGSWLRNINNAGPIDEIGAFLSEIWMDEIGNGDPAQNHANIYVDLQHSASIYLPPLNSRAYAYNSVIWEESFESPVYQHAISTFSEAYYPELLGMTLYLEWEANFLAAMVKLYEYHGYPSLFYKLHVAIDNTAHGHGAKARDAVQLYLDKVRIESGDREMQEHWKRIWRGYIAFGFIGGGGWRFNFDNPPSLIARMVEMIERKKHHGQLNHGERMLGANLINDWFDDPWGFLAELSRSSFIVRGDAEASPLLQLLGPTGPMLKVFSDEEVALWKEWINSLERMPLPTEGPGDAMVIMINEMRGKGIGERAHRSYVLEGPDPHGKSGDRIKKPVDWWFQVDNPSLSDASERRRFGAIAFMRALKDPANDWIVPGSADQSRFVRELLSDDGKMAQLLIAQVPEADGKTGRQIIIEWIDAGCPEPTGATTSSPTRTLADSLNVTPLNVQTEKLSAVFEQQRREEFLGLIPLVSDRPVAERRALRQRQYGPGAGAPH